MIFSLAGFVLLYSIFIVIEMYLMIRAVRQGPDETHGGEVTSDESEPVAAPAGATAAPAL
jgi:cytochrome d ubiquinol oxidase subunit I